MGAELLAWTGVVALLTISPGADMALVARQAIGSSVRVARFAALGIVTGTLVWGGLSAVGVAALVAASATAYDVLRLMGAAYLVFLGLTAMRDARRGLWGGAGAPAPGRATPRAAFRQGLLTNLLNPKVGVFYAAVLPQFLGPDDSVFALSLLMASIHAVLGIVWLSTYAWLLGRLRSFFQRPRVRATFEAVTGTVLVLLGLRVAVGDR
jgi:threonine/homoserine/homoserine lactone efflux protein